MKTLVETARRFWPLRQPLLLIVLVLFSASCWAFVEIADEVMEGDSHEIDRRILLALRSPGSLDDPVGPRWLEELMRDFTALGGTGIVILVSVIAVTLLWVTLNVRYARLLMIALAGAFLVSLTMKYLFDRPRPDLVPHGSIVYTRSFPSGHSMVSACVYLTLAAILAEIVQPPRLKWFFVVVALAITFLVGCSRVYLGVHWPSDVLAGWTAGGAWALACWLVARLLYLRTLRIATSEPRGNE